MLKCPDYRIREYLLVPKKPHVPNVNLNQPNANPNQPSATPNEEVEYSSH